MSRPRRPFGSTRPGQLPATRLKVLAAELSDPDRLRRGRTYATDGSVVDITVDDGVTTATVLGSRSDPYLVELVTETGDGPPARPDVEARCTCPDDDLRAHTWCKHAIAALLVLADEIAIDPAVLDRWRGSGPDEPADPVGTGVSPLAGARPATPREVPPERRVARSQDPLAGALSVPVGVAMPAIPEITTTGRVPINDPALDELVAGALITLTTDNDAAD